jgi:2'-5' RNA ligase
MPIRAFLAVPLPATIQEALAKLARTVPGLRSQRPDTIHLTIRFLGEISDPDAVVAAVAPVAAKHPAFFMSL